HELPRGARRRAARRGPRSHLVAGGGLCRGRDGASEARADGTGCRPLGARATGGRVRAPGGDSEVGRRSRACDNPPDPARRRPLRARAARPVAMRRAAGFTLLELMIAIALFGVVALLVYGAAQAGLDTEGRLAVARRRLQSARAM